MRANNCSFYSVLSVSLKSKGAAKDDDATTRVSRKTLEDSQSENAKVEHKEQIRTLPVPECRGGLDLCMFAMIVLSEKSASPVPFARKYRLRYKTSAVGTRFESLDTYRRAGSR